MSPPPHLVLSIITRSSLFLCPPNIGGVSSTCCRSQSPRHMRGVTENTCGPSPFIRPLSSFLCPPNIGGVSSTCGRCQSPRHMIGVIENTCRPSPFIRPLTDRVSRCLLTPKSMSLGHSSLLADNGLVALPHPTG